MTSKLTVLTRRRAQVRMLLSRICSTLARAAAAVPRTTVPLHAMVPRRAFAMPATGSGVAYFMYHNGTIAGAAPKKKRGRSASAPPPSLHMIRGRIMILIPISAGRGEIKS